MKLNLTVIACTACLWVAAGDQVAQDFKPLFNGRDLSGWVEMGRPGAYVVEEGTLVLKTPQNFPNWLLT